MSTITDINTASSGLVVDVKAFRNNVKELVKIRDELDELTHRKKALSKQHNELQAEVIQQMQQLGKTSCNLRDGSLVLKETKRTKQPAKKAVVGAFEELLGPTKTSEIVEKLTNAQESTIKTVLQRKRTTPTSESTVEQPSQNDGASSVADGAA